MDQVRLVVNPGRKARDRIGQRDVGPGEEFTASEKEARLAVATGVASRVTETAPKRRGRPPKAMVAETPAAQPEAYVPLPDGTDRPVRRYMRRDLISED